MSPASMAAVTSRRCSRQLPIFAWSEVLAKAELPGRDDVGAMRLRTVATSDKPVRRFLRQAPAEDYDHAVLLDLDYCWC